MLGDDWRHDLCTWKTDDQVEHSRTLVTYFVCAPVLGQILYFSLSRSCR